MDIREKTLTRRLVPTVPVETGTCCEGQHMVRRIEVTRHKMNAHFLRRAQTLSMWKVWGNMSTG